MYFDAIANTNPTKECKLRKIQIYVQDQRLQEPRSRTQEQINHEDEKQWQKSMYDENLGNICRKTKSLNNFIVK